MLPLLFKDTDITYEITVPNIVLSKRSPLQAVGHLGRGEAIPAAWALSEPPF